MKTPLSHFRNYFRVSARSQWSNLTLHDTFGLSVSNLQIITALAKQATSDKKQRAKN